MHFISGADSKKVNDSAVIHWWQSKTKSGIFQVKYAIELENIWMIQLAPYDSFCWEFLDEAFS